MSVGIEQLLEVGNLSIEFLAFIGVGHQHTVGGHLHDLCGRLDVGASQDGIFRAGEWLVLYQLEATAVVDQRVAGNASLLVVSLRETAVDDHQLAVGLDRVLTTTHLDGHVTVDDMTVLSCHAKGLKDVIADGLVVA